MSKARPMAPARITRTAIVTSLGRGRAAHLNALKDGSTGLRSEVWRPLPFDCPIGRVDGIEEDPVPARLSAWDNRASRLALAALDSEGLLAALAAVRNRWGAARCAIVLGTSTSGVETLEQAYLSRSDTAPLPAEYSLRHHNDHQAITAFLQKLIGFDGPAYTISTACSSSAKALVDAVQMVEAGIADAVLCGGVDSLCLTSLNGFEALQLVSREPCRPCDANRDGLTIAEGAAFLLVERGGEGPRLAGYGESSDGTNMSTPPPDGAGAVQAMTAALSRAGLRADEIDYVNLHGTATPANDVAECAAVSHVFGNEVPVSSLKGAVGHTLGAAGAVEAVLSLVALEDSLIPGNVGLRETDPAIACNILASSKPGRLRAVMSNAFGFGGNNCALLLAP